MPTLAALFDRSRSGRGHRIDIAMVDSMTRFMAPRIVPYLGTGDIPQRTGARDSVIAIYQAFDTQDEPLTLGLGNDAIWKRFWQAVGTSRRGDDARYAATPIAAPHARKSCAEIQEMLNTAAARRMAAGSSLQAKVPAGPVNRVDKWQRPRALCARSALHRPPRPAAAACRRSAWASASMAAASSLSHAAAATGRAYGRAFCGLAGLR